MLNNVIGIMWYLDIGASFDMTGNRDLFCDFEEKYLKKNTGFGDDGRYSATNISTITFQWESGSPLKITNVMYVLGLKKNLVSIMVLEYHGYDVIFSKGKVFLRHITTRQVKQIDVRVKNLLS